MFVQNISFIFFFGILLFFALAFLFRKEACCSGSVIVLNGPSGSGKSSIQKEFQKIMMPDLWIKLGIDNLFDSPLPDITPENVAYWQSKNSIRWVKESQDETNNIMITLFLGPEGEKVACAMNSAIAAYAKNGCNVIVDYIAYDQAWLKDLEKKIQGCKPCYVAVDIPLKILEQREKARGTSPVGHARSHYKTVYGDLKYDLRVNSADKSAEEIAQEIRSFIQKNAY